jgi:hypothetical protein
VALPLDRLPRYLVLEPVSTVRFEVELGRPACEIDVELENPKPGRSFLLLIGPQGGPVIQRMRMTGRARVVFEPRDPRAHVLMLANPQQEPLVLRLRGRRMRRSRPAVAPPRPRREARTSTSTRSARPRPAGIRVARPAAEPRLPRSGSPGPVAGRLRAARPKG